MITMELESRRQLIMEAIAELDSAEALGKVQKYIQNLQKKKEKEKPPCQYTVEERHQILDEADREIGKGAAGFTTEELRREMLTWK